MPCLLLLLAVLTPRLLIVIIWLMSDWFSGIFTSIVWPLLGFVFLPTTLLWYTAVYHWYGGIWEGWRIVVLIIAVVIDASPAGSRGRRTAG